MLVSTVEMNTDYKSKNDQNSDPVLLRLKFFDPLKHEIKLRKYFNSSFYFIRFSNFILAYEQSFSYYSYI